MLNERQDDDLIRAPGLPGYLGLARNLWGQHLVPFAVAFLTLTSLMLLNQIAKQLPSLRATGAPTATMLNVFVLSVPFIVAVTLPMAVLVAVLRVFNGRPGNSDLVAMRRRGVTPMRAVGVALAGATLVAGFALLWNDKVVPSSNHELRTLLVEIQPSGTATSSERGYKGDRELSIAELRRAVRGAEEEAGKASAEGDQLRERAARQRAAIHAVEMHKKYAVSAACVVFALLGAGLGLRIRGGGWPLVIGVSVAVFVIQYIGLIAGEDLGDRLVVAPFVAIWTPNLVIAIVGLSLLWSINKSAGADLSAAAPHA